MLTEVCTGENIRNFKEGSSGLNFHCPVESLPLSEQVSESFYMRDNDSSESVDVQDHSAVDVQEGSFGVNLSSAVETLSVSRKLFDPSCTENDDLSKSVDAQDITGDFQEGSSAIDLKCNVEKICVSHQLYDPSCTENNDVSNNLDTQDFSGADIWEGLSAFDINANVENLFVTQPLSDPSCTANEDLSKSVDPQGFSGIDAREGSSSIDPSSTVGKIPGSDPSCTENDDFSKDVIVQDLSGIDVREVSSVIDPNSTVGNIPGSDPSCTENDDLSESVDEQELSGSDVREGSSAIDPNSTVGNIPGSDPPCIENDDLSKSVDAQDLFGIDVREGSSVIDPNSTFGKIPGSDPSCTENDDFSKDVNAQDLSGADLPEGSSAIDEKLLVTHQLSDPSSTENNDMSKTVDAQDLPGADLQKGLFPMNSKSTTEISTVSEQFSEPSISKNDILSKSMDSLALSGADFSEQLSTVDLDSAIMKLSVSQHLSEPFCVGDINVNKSMDTHLRDEVSVAALDCINYTDGPFKQSDNGGKGCIMVDGASAENLAEIKCVSPRKRSLRKTRSRQNSQTAKPTRSLRNLTNRKMSLDFNSFQITRRRRSYVVKRARSSVWGLLTDVQVIEQNGRIESNVNEHKKPSRARGGQGRGKQEKNQSQYKKSNKKKSSITGSISSKSKVGEEVGSSSIMDAFSTDINIDRHFKTKVNFPDLAKDEDLPRSIGSQGCKENLDRIVALSDDSVLDFCHAGKDLVENLDTKTSNDCQQFMSGEELDKLRTPNDSMGLDPGTSPDSEVINLNLDAPLIGKGLEDLHDILSSSQVCDASEDALSLSPMRKCIKKGKKKKKMVQRSDCSAGDELMNSEILDNDPQLVEVEQGEKGSDVSYSADASAATANASGNTSSTEGISKEPLPSRVADFGMSCATCKVGGSEINLSTSVGTEFESSVSQMSNKVLPRNKGRKIPKSAKTEGVRKGRLEVPTSANKKESTTRKKVNQDKLASKLKLKDKVNGGLVSCEVEHRVETDLGEFGTGNSSLTEEVSTLDIDHKGVMEQYTKPRNAWVLCDDCHKWRRIQATLADQIGESNCRWTCKDNLDKNFADCSVAQEKSNAEINAELDISDASCDEDACDARRNSNQLRKKQSADVQQSKWKLIRSNLFLHRNRKTQIIDEIMVCHCKAPSDGGMGCGDGCLNRMLNIECVRGTCPCGDLCSNQQFQKRKYAKLECFKCGKKGFGLQGLEDISEGQFLIEYVGEVLDMHAYEARQKEYALNGHKHFYFMTLNGSEVIDACAKGNLGRFINHSCDPNCRTEKWMVNGEVCIGLFALRNIKKGEELTFDYNYVRVFGAAAKKCVCGSSQCRGYIGGDPQNAEVIVQDESDDEYPEPIMVCEDGVVDENLNVTMPMRSSFGWIETMTAKKSPKNMDKLNESERIYKHLDIASEVLSAETEFLEKVETDNSATAVGHVEIIEESGDSLHRSSSAALKVDISEASTGQLQSLNQPQTSLNPDDLSSEIVTIDEQECSEAERIMKRSSCSTAAYEENSPGTMVSKLAPDVMDNKRKLKSHIGKRRVKSSKSHPSTKASRPSSVKKEKPTGLPVNGKKLQEMHSKVDVLSCKSKKIVDGSSGGRFEAVQEKLGALLDHDGGISKRRDSSRGYLKLLLLTAASGDSGNGETIQSNRDLSMILDALLKTKSRTVLVDILNKNGLQMLHNMLKRYRKEFNKIPILRKLLKGFEYLATREILTSEHINGGPPCPGVESFRESILSFTEHTDRQVHQSARNFRDRWIPRSSRKNNCMEWEDSKMEFHRGLDSSRFPTHNHRSDRSGRHSETPDCITQPIVTSSTVDNGSAEGSSFQSCSGGARTRKRKSRWDQPGDLDPRVETNIASDGKQTIDDDVPPGFAVPLNASVVPSDSSSNARCVRPKLSSDLKLEHETVMGHPQQRFLSRLPVSYGVPMCIAQQVGTPQPGRLEGWSIAPGMPFNPFPPLPSYPRHKTDPISNVADSSGAEQDCTRSANHHSGLNPPSSSRASMFDVEPPEEKNRLNFQQTRESSTVGRRFFRQQKWNNAKPCPPWIRNRNNWGPMGNNSRNGMYNVGLGNGTNEFRNSHGMEKANSEVDGSAYHHHHHQPPQY